MATNIMTDEQIKMALRERVGRVLQELGSILVDINRLDGIETLANYPEPKN